MKMKSAYVGSISLLLFVCHVPIMRTESDRVVLMCILVCKGLKTGKQPMGNVIHTSGEIAYCKGYIKDIF